MNTYHLYLDESGKFDKTQQHCLIGGFLCKGEAFEKEEAKKILSDVRNSFSEDAAFKRILDEGKRLTELKQERFKIREKLHNENVSYNERKRLCKQRDALSNQIESIEVDYIFEHCSENSRTPERWRRQKQILERFEAKLEEARSETRFVVFTAPKDKFYIDVNTTYLTVMSLGLMRLYNALQKENGGIPVDLYIHTAARKNTLVKGEDEDEDQEAQLERKEQLANTPLPADKDEDGNVPHNLTLGQYQAQLQNCAFLRGGYSLLRIKEFRNMLSTIEILEDDFGTANPFTVFCDYICNSYYVSMYQHDQGFKAHFSSLGKRVLTYKIFENSDLKTSDFSIDLLRQTHDWGSGLIELISRNFPKESTARFFTQMNADARYNQLACVDAVVLYLKPFVANRENMSEWCDRIYSAIKQCEEMDKDAHHILACHLYLYLDALYTHLGKGQEAKRACELFLENVASVRDTDQCAKLMLIFGNREIVTATDGFAYELGTTYFNHLRQYWNDYETISNYLIDGIAGIWKKEKDFRKIKPALSEYGKTMGSYVQLITHVLHSEQVSEKWSKAREEGVQLIQELPGLFTTAPDLSRSYQNICRLQAEIAFGARDENEKLEFYRQAVASLRTAVEYEMSQPANENESNFEMDCRKIIGYTGTFGKEDAFVYLHYTALMHRMLLDYCDRARKFGLMMWETAMGDLNPESRDFASFLKSPYPGCIMLWHLASSAAYAKAHGSEVIFDLKLANDLLQGASMVLAGEQATRIAMAIGIGAEQIALMKKGLLPKSSGKKDEMARAFKNLTNRYKFFQHEQKGRVDDPFAGCFQNLTVDKAAEVFMDIARRIAY